MKIGFLYNVKLVAPSLTDETAQIYAEFDSPETIEGIKKAIESNGHQVHMIEANEEAYNKLKTLKEKSEIDLVFNIAEGIYGEAREAQIPAMLEMLKIPYTGSGPINLAITLDKARTKEILSYYKIPNAKFQVFSNSNEKLNLKLKFPLIVKPLNEGSSKGIMDNCVLRSQEELKNKLNEINNKFNQPAIVEEFLEGREFTVAVLEDLSGPKVLPIIEVKFNELPENMNKIDSYEAKWFYDDPSKGIDPLVCPAEIDKKLENKIKKVALKTFNVLNCKDFSRLDIRLDKNGNPNVIEVNALPGIIPNPDENSRFPRAARVAGIEYNKLIKMVIDSAIKRYKLK